MWLPQSSLGIISVWTRELPCWAGTNDKALALAMTKLGHGKVEVLDQEVLWSYAFLQVLEMFILVLQQCHKENEDKWKRLSRQIADIILPMLAKQQVCHHSLGLPSCVIYFRMDWDAYEGWVVIIISWQVLALKIVVIAGHGASSFFYSHYPLRLKLPSHFISGEIKVRKGIEVFHPHRAWGCRVWNWLAQLWLKNWVLSTETFLILLPWLLYSSQLGILFDL